MYFSQTLYNLEECISRSDKKKYLSVKEKLLNEVSSKFHDFINVLNKKNIKEIETIGGKLRKFKNVIFLGTGGSSLGGKTLVSLKEKSITGKSPNIFFIENIDLGSIDELISKIDFNRTAIVVISKSGETIETLAQFFYIRDHIKKNNFFTKFLIITENKKSTLKAIQEQENFEFIEHCSGIGGRFSVLSVVGLLPASIVGLKITDLSYGAKYFLNEITKNDGKYFDQYFLSSLAQVSLMEKDVNICVIMPYVDRLINFSLWFRQLWAESIGKNNRGSTPLTAVGTVDQHSQLQLFLDGPKDKFFTIIGHKKKKTKTKIDCSFGKNNIFEILHKKNLDLLLYYEMKATIMTIRKHKLPIRFFELNNISERTIGALIMFFLIETIFCCYLIDVDPFSQPAVEEGKKITKNLLQK